MQSFSLYTGVVGCGEGVGYLMSPGRPTDNGFQLGKACYPCSRGNILISSVSSLSFLFLFLPCPSLLSPLLSLLSLFSLSLGDDTKWPTRVDVLNLNTINQILPFNIIKTNWPCGGDRILKKCSHLMVVFKISEIIYETFLFIQILTESERSLTLHRHARGSDV